MTAEPVQVLMEDYELFKLAAEEFAEKQEKGFEVVAYYQQKKKEEFEICLMKGAMPIASFYMSAAANFDAPIYYKATIELNSAQTELFDVAVNFIKHMKGMITKTKI